MLARKEKAIAEMTARGEAQSLKWFRKYYKKVYIDSDLPPDLVPRNALVLYNEILKWENEKAAQASQPEEPERKPRRFFRSCDFTREEIESKPMFPVEPEIFELLYCGISHNDEGRKLYLSIRNQLRPNDKYYEPQGFGMDYGWKIEERALRPDKSHARYQMIKDEFYRRYGVKGETLRNNQPISAARVAVEEL